MFTWTNGIVSISDRTHKLYTAGPDGSPVLLKKVFDSDGNVIWTNNLYGVFEFEVGEGRSAVSYKGTDIYVSVDSGPWIHRADSPDYWNIIYFSTTKVSKITLTGNITNISFDESPNVHDYNVVRILTPFPATMKDVNNFGWCFGNCHSLTSIPTGLFDNCPNAMYFNFCFYECDSLMSIPAGLFDNCSNASQFIQCFGSCRSLTTIPEGLFDNCPNVTHFGSRSYAFGGGCFEACTNLTGAAPALWLRTNPVPSGWYCFYGCTGLSNYGDIPSDWK